jgi:hypothetical protein
MKVFQVAPHEAHAWDSQPADADWLDWPAGRLGSVREG